MFGKKKAPLPEGIRLMHYEGLPGFAQDAPCFMEQTAGVPPGGGPQRDPAAGQG